MDYQNQSQPVSTPSAPPAGQLKTNRGMLKVILLSLITFGIYGLVYCSGISTDINVIASRYDGKKTMHYCLLFFVLAPITGGIAALVWNHKLAERMGNELKRRGISYGFGAGDYWLWAIVGSLIVVGPFVFLHKQAAAMNKLCEHYNVNG